MTSTTRFDLGLIGLGVMGENLALNFSRQGHAVLGYDLYDAKRTQFAQRTQGTASGVAASLAAVVAGLAQPRCVLLMVPAGAPVDALCEALWPMLAPGDVVIDGGNSHFADTARRLERARALGIHWVGCGISGGEEGALKGPALMPGGDAQAWPRVRPLLQSIAARAADGEPCCAWMGQGGAGHLVKMVHNGIEYADMQLIGEVYALMQAVLGWDAPTQAAQFREWNRGALESYLIAITADILDRADEFTGRPLVEFILDTAEQKGTGKWTSQVALDLGVAAPTITEAVYARLMSARKAERVQAAAVLTGPKAAPGASTDLAAQDLHDALLMAKVCAYAQGFAILGAANQQHGWALAFDQVASVWRAGCIIRARLLEEIRASYAATPALPNLLIAPHFQALLTRCEAGLRRVVQAAVRQGVPVPALMSALAYYDAYRSERLPANLLQAQRDYFGAHTYQRTDRPGVFHTQWV